MILNDEVRIRIASRQPQFFLHEHQKLRGEFPVRRRAKADRIGVAVADCLPVVGEMRREIEHIPRFEHGLALGPEALENLKGDVFPEREVALAADLPAPAAGALQQEHIVGIEVRPDASTVRGIADHQVVQPAVGNEAEARK